MKDKLSYLKNEVKRLHQENDYLKCQNLNLILESNYLYDELFYIYGEINMLVTIVGKDYFGC